MFYVYHIDTCVGGAPLPSHVYPGFVASVCKLPMHMLFICINKDIRFYEGVHIFQRKSFGGSVCFRKIVWAHDFGGVQIFQRGAKFSSKISVEGHDVPPCRMSPWTFCLSTGCPP